MSRKQSVRTAVTVAAAALGLVLVMQADAQGRGQSGGAAAGMSRGGVGAGGFGNMRVGTDRGWPRGSDTPAPSRLPTDKAFGKKGRDASSKKAANASGAAENGGAKAEAAIAAAGTGGPTGKGQGGDAGLEGRAVAAGAVSAGTDAAIPGSVSADEGAAVNNNKETATAKGRSADAPGHTGQTGLTQATLRANEHAQKGLDQAISRQRDEEENSQPPQN